MSQRFEGASPGEPGSMSQNGTSQPEPVRRSWRPCQMLNQDGEVVHHHQTHHHHHQRNRRRPHNKHTNAATVHSPVTTDPTPSPTPHPRPAVTRYRRHGDPNPRLRARQRQPIREEAKEMNDESPEVERQGSFQNELQSNVSTHQTPEAIVSPTNLTQDLTNEDRDDQPAAEETDQLQHGCEQRKMDKSVVGETKQEEEIMEGKTMEEKVPEVKSAVEPEVKDLIEKNEEAVEQGPEAEEATDEVVETSAARESEITDLCSDTESATSLSLDGPLHSPPPLQSPTPPSSPDAPHFPQMDHFSEDMSPLPDNDTPPEDEEEEEEDCYESKPCPELYPKTYADFYTESHLKSYPEPKMHPNSFPEPLKTAYPLNKPKQEPRTRPENVPKKPPKDRDRAFPNLPLDSSIGCRLHHYDGQSDGENSDRSPVPRTRKQEMRRGEAQEKSCSTGQSRSGLSSGEVPEERTTMEQGTKGDAISLAIRGIKEAIEEVKTKAVRSPYTPDQPGEPIWVMRQEASPTDDTMHMAVGQYSPGSQPECLSRYPSTQDPVSPMRAESSRAYHQPPAQTNPQQQQDTVYQRDNPLQTYPSDQLPHRAAQSPPQQPSTQEICRSLPPFPTFVDVPGPCDPEDLIDGIIFAATYLGCTHLLSERTPSKSARMQQAQEAMSRVRAAQKQDKNRKKSSDREASSTVEVDLFMSTQRIKVLNADTQECLMDLPLRTISYIADIGNMVVLMARGKMVRSRSAQENLDSGEHSLSPDDRRLYRMICHVFESDDAQLIAQSIGQSFSVAYQEFLRANGIDPEDLSQTDYSDLLSTQDMYNEDLIHFSKSENCRDVYIEKQKGEILGVVIVESGWGSILPTVIIASMMHSGPAQKSGRLNIGDQIMTINGTSLVGLPLSTCQSIIKGLKSQSRIKMNIVRCPPVTMVLIRRPDLRYQLGFSVQNGIICSLMRGGIAERGGVRVGHRIIEINSQSVVATPHEKIVQILSNAMGEIHMKTMPAAMYRLLTAQEQPVYI